MIRLDKHKDYPQFFIFPRVRFYEDFGIVVLAWLFWAVSFAKRASVKDAANWNIQD